MAPIHRARPSPQALDCGDLSVVAWLADPSRVRLDGAGVRDAVADRGLDRVNSRPVSSHRLNRATCRSAPTIERSVYPRSRNSAEYASANRANGPVINTLDTLLDGLAIISSFSDDKKDDDRPNRWRYADIYTAINPNRKMLLSDIGITRTSAYSYLCRRRHNHDLRHTFGTRMIAKADIRRVQEWMGHADIQTTMKYRSAPLRPARGRRAACRRSVRSVRAVAGGRSGPRLNGCRSVARPGPSGRLRRGRGDVMPC